MNYLHFFKRFFVEVGHQIRFNVGRMLRQTGLHFDRKGSVLEKDIAFLEPINRHRNILVLENYQLAISPTTYVAPNATVYGDVYIAKDGYIGFGAVVDGYRNPVRIGSNVKVGDNTTIQSAFWVPDLAFPLSTTIGNNVNIQHSSNIVNAIIDDDVHIGFRTVVMEGAQLQRGSVIAPNSYVAAGSRIPQNTLWAGNPVRFVKHLEPLDKRQKLEWQDSRQIHFIGPRVENE